MITRNLSLLRLYICFYDLRSLASSAIVFCLKYTFAHLIHSWAVIDSFNRLLAYFFFISLKKYSDETVCCWSCVQLIIYLYLSWVNYFVQKRCCLSWLRFNLKPFYLVLDLILISFFAILDIKPAHVSESKHSKLSNAIDKQVIGI